MVKTRLKHPASEIDRDDAVDGGRAELRPLSIVLVDDDVPTQRLYKTLLTMCLEPADVRVAGSAKEALALLRKEQADLLLSDYRMPGMDGLALIEASAREGLARRRVLFSNQMDPWLAGRAHESGAHAFFDKFDCGLLMDGLEKVVAPLRA